MTQTIAILGGTGGTGRAIIQQLLQKDDILLRLYVRSQSKLIGLFPTLRSDSRVQIFEGAITEISAVAECLKGAQIIICAVGQNENRPGIHAMGDTAQSVVSALEKLREHTTETWYQPRVLQLSAAPWNDRFRAQSPKLLHWVLTTAFWWTYVDLLNAHDILKGASLGLIKLTLVQPPGFVEDVPSGPVLSTESTAMTVTYTDLAAGFIEIALNKEYGELKEIGVCSKDGDNFRKHGLTLLGRMAVGLCAGWIPFYWTIHDAVFG